MSRETTAWLNQNVLVGFTSKRQAAWHMSERFQGDESNHYAEEIPLADVTRRLFNWEAVSSPLYVEAGEGFAPVPGKQAILRSDTNAVLGMFTEGYVAHQYSEWLLTNVSNILDSDLQIGSAGLLRGGAQAWVQAEMPETVVTPEGESFRPFITASTSLDGSLATSYQVGATRVICDNSLSMFHSETGPKFKAKHTKHSGYKIAAAREALQIVHTMSDDFAAEIKALCEMDVTNDQWNTFLDLETAPKKDATKHGVTMAENHRDALQLLWTSDMRVNPYKNTAWGVIQAVSTYAQHEAIVRGASRPERNQEKALKGHWADVDASTFKTLSTKVLQLA